jgi:hypothetical protein
VLHGRVLEFGEILRFKRAMRRFVREEKKSRTYVGEVR